MTEEFDYERDKHVLLSKTNFSEYIERQVLENPGLTYFDAIIKFTNESDKEPEELLKYMTPVLIEKIKRSAIQQELIRDDSNTLEDML